MGDTEVAVAIRYDPAERKVPFVTARGRGALARRIVELARQHGLPVHRDASLARLLARLEPGTSVPVESFAAIAEILALLYRLDRAHDPASGG